MPAAARPAVPRAVLGATARVGGAVLAAGFGLTARVRGTRALHPVGVSGQGRVNVVPGPPSGVPLLDDPGPHACAVRWSRATGRQRGWDVEGLALRLAEGGDLLLASTRTGVLGRHLLVLRRPDEHGPLTTLLPLQTARGSLLLALDPVPHTRQAGSPAQQGRRGPTGAVVPPTAYRLLVSAPGRPWHPRGTLEISWNDQDTPRRHDPVGRPPVGTWVHPFWARLRDPSYVASQQVPARVVEPRPTDPEGAAGSA